MTTLITAAKETNTSVTTFRLVRPSKKKKRVARPDFYKKESGRAVFLLFIISYCMLTLHILTIPQELLGQILVKRNIRY